jgi:hypothetical protein
MARYVVKFAILSAAGMAAVAAVKAEMAASGLLGLAKFYPEIGAGAFVVVERSAAEIAAIVAEEFAMGEAMVAIAAAKASSALAVKGASMFPGIVPCECF